MAIAYGKTQIVVCRNNMDLGKISATDVAAKLRELLAAQPLVRAVFAAGESKACDKYPPLTQLGERELDSRLATFVGKVRNSNSVNADRTIRQCNYFLLKAGDRSISRQWLKME
jgi:hypothetical protein